MRQGKSSHGWSRRRPGIGGLQTQVDFSQPLCYQIKTRSAGAR